MTNRPYTGRRWRFGKFTGTVCSEPFSLTLGQVNGNDLNHEMTHGCVAVSLDVEWRGYFKPVTTATDSLWMGTIIGHTGDLEKDERPWP